MLKRMFNYQVRSSFCTKPTSTKGIQIKNAPIDVTKFQDPSNVQADGDFITSLYQFSMMNNIDYSTAQRQYADKLFLKSKVELKHLLSDSNINEFKEGIKKNDYAFYDIYKNMPEVNRMIIQILVLGRSNVGKSSLINKLFMQDLTKTSKTPGKTQALEFFLVNYNKRDTGFLVDSPGFGYVEGPVILRKKFKYLIYSYLNYSIRLNLILYLVNGEYGMKKVDEQELEMLNNFGRPIQIVLTKVDSFARSDPVKYLSQISNFIKPLKYIRPDIFLTSSR